MARKALFRLKGLDPVFFTFHLLFLGITYTIYLAPHIAPSTFAYFSFIPIAYPLLVLGNIIIILILFFRRTIYAVLFLLLSIGLYPPLTKSYQYFGKEATIESDFKILTYNVQYLREDGFKEFFEKEDADVVLMQEIYWQSDILKTLKETAFSDYYHEHFSYIQLFSKYPIIEAKKIFTETLTGYGVAGYADIDTGKDTIRIINVYLGSMLIDKGLVKETLNSETAEENSKKIKNKLTTGFLAHEKQIKALIPYISSSKHPVILAGDLNSVPNSYEYQQLIYWLNDAYPTVGKSAGTSFHEYKYPLKLDYILHSKEILPVKYEVLNNISLSDHYPVVGHFKLP